MTTKMPKTYGDAGARRLLGDHLGQEPKYLPERMEAARELLRQFTLLVADYGVDNRTDGGGLMVVTPRGERTITVNENSGRVIVGTDAGGTTPVPLFFNPKTGMFEGTALDQVVTPAPGDLRPRRSALEVLVAEVFGQNPSDLPRPRL